MVRRATSRRKTPAMGAATRRIAGAGQPAIDDFLNESRRRLRDEYLPKIVRAAHQLDEEQLWWRPNASSNSAANLILHLEGNIRHWILHGVCGAPSRRDRDAEFARRGGVSRRTLLSRLRRAVLEVDTALARVTPAQLTEAREIQGYSVTVLQAIYHVVEHFSGHTGQILYIAKLQAGRDLTLYPHLERGARKRSRRAPYM